MLVQSYLRRDDYTSSTISRQMEEFDDRISIHIATPTLESRNHARGYNNPCYVLKSNTPTPLSSYRTPRQRHEVRKNLDPTRFKLQGIPPYVHNKENTP